MEDIPFSNESYKLWLLLSGTQAAISQARQKKIGRYVHHNQAAALVMIWGQQGQATPGYISHGLFLKHHSVSELLTRLEKKGYIEKNRDAEMRNIVRLSITQKGMDYCTRVTQAGFIIQIMTTLSGEQRRQLRNLLQLLANAAQTELDS